MYSFSLDICFLMLGNRFCLVDLYHEQVQLPPTNCYRNILSVVVASYPDFPPVPMNGSKLYAHTSFKELRLSASPNLTWKTHIHSLAKHASQKLGFLARARGFFSSSHLLTIYKSQIRPSVEYCLPRPGVVLQNLLSVFLTKSSPKPFVSSTVLTSPNRSTLFPIAV